MEPLFSSPQHMVWFVLSMVLLAISLFTWRSGWPFFGYLAAIHFVTVIEAVAAVCHEGNGPVYSIHCIWFNLLMSAVYIALWLHAGKM